MNLLRSPLRVQGAPLPSLSNYLIPRCESSIISPIFQTRTKVIVAPPLTPEIRGVEERLKLKTIRGKDMINKKIMFFINHNKIQDALDMLDYYKYIRRGHRVREFTISKVLHDLGTKGKHGAIEHVLSEYQEFIPETKENLTSILLGYAKGGKNQVPKMISSFEKLKEKNYHLDPFVYTTLIYGYAKKLMKEEMEKTFDEMVSLGIKPNNTTYTAMMKYYSQIGDINKTLELFEETKKFQPIPSRITYFTLIKTFAKVGDEENMIKYFHEMDRNIGADSIHFEVLIRYFANKLDTKSMDKYILVLKDRKLFPSPRMYLDMLSAFARTGDLNQMTSILNEIIANNTKIPLRVCENIFQILNHPVSLVDLQHMKKVLEELKGKIQ